MNAPLVPVTLTFLMGILLGASVPLPVWSITGVGIVSAGAALWGWRRNRVGLIALLLLWGCLGALRMVVWEQHPATRLKGLLTEALQPVTLHGLVVDDPVELFEPGEAEPNPSSQQSAISDQQPAVSNQRSETRDLKQTCVLSLRHRRTDGGWQPIAGRVRATIMSPREPLRYGDEILVEGQWSLVPAPGNPGQYDWKSALARKRIHGLLRVRPFDGLVVLRHEQESRLLNSVFQLRHRWERLIRDHFHPRDAGLLLGLLLGQRAEIDEGLKDAFIETGTIHLLVISGFNVGIVAVVLEMLLRLLGLPWRWRLAVAALGVGGYAVLVGMQPPVMRAALMAWIVFGAMALDRVINWPNTLAAAALAILLVDPVQLFDAGFQLSFGAVLSLIAFTGRLQAWLTPRLTWMRLGWLQRHVSTGVAATVAVWIGLWPILAWYFFLLSPISVMANLLLTPLLSALIAGGTSLMLVATVAEACLDWGQGIVKWLLHATVACVSWCHTMPAGHIYVGRPPAWIIGGYYALLVASLLRRRWGWGISRVTMGWIAAMGVAIGLGVIGQWHQSRWLRLEALDVGHGDSLLLRTPHGRTWLIDAGSQEAGRSRVLPTLRARGIGALDGLLLTHWDEDHAGGAVPLLEALRVGRLFTNGTRGATAVARRVRALAAARGVDMVALSAGMSLNAESSLAIDVLHPPAGLVPGVPPVSNENALVLRVSKGSVSFLLTGDIEEGGLPWLMASPAPLRSTVLKVPHHGSRLGEVGERFFRAVAPQLAVLSVGRIHHLPSEETLEALRRAGTRLYLTRDRGAITLQTDGTQLRVRTFR